MRAVASHSSRCRWAWRVRGGGLCQHSVPRLWRAPWRPSSWQQHPQAQSRTAPALPNRTGKSLSREHPPNEHRRPAPSACSSARYIKICSSESFHLPQHHLSTSATGFMCACLCSGSVSNMLTAACLLTVASPVAAECVADLVRQKPNALTLSYPLTCINCSESCHDWNIKCHSILNNAPFPHQVYHLASVRLRDLCAKLDISADLRRKIWTCFEYSLVHCTDLMMDRHLDQLLMCAIYVMTKVFEHYLSNTSYL